ncbi:MAG: hypothetical protein L7H12_05015 [Sulfolobales archaeon]|nr:hypothetical protein [Sulfolobales archaeon]
MGALVGFISYYITFTYSLNFDLALLSMGLVFVLGLLLPGAVAVGLVTLYLASFLAIVSDAVYRVGLDNLMNVIIALVTVTVLSFVLPIYVYVRTRAVGVLAWGMTPLIISVFILHERLETLPYISQPSPGVSFLLGLFTVNPNVFGELEGSLYVLSVLGLLSPSLNVRQRWKHVVFAPLSPLSYFVVILLSNGLQGVEGVTTPLVLTMLLVAFSSATLVVLNYVEGDLLKLSAAILVANNRIRTLKDYDRARLSPRGIKSGLHVLRHRITSCDGRSIRSLALLREVNTGETDVLLKTCKTSRGN